MLDNLKKYDILLGSASPRRRELLSTLGLNFTIKTISGIEETYPEDLTPEQVPGYLSRLKASAYTLTPTQLLITADTVVINDGIVLGKPTDRADAIRMLRSLSAKTHKVVTGVSITTVQKQKSFSVETLVTFDTLSDEEITHYVDTYKPFDKAGSYGIQEWIGCIAVSRIEGSFYNVIGLPVQRLYQELKYF